MISKSLPSLFFIGHDKPRLHPEDFLGVPSNEDQPSNFDNGRIPLSSRRVNGQNIFQPQQQTSQNTSRSTNGITCPSCGDYFNATQKRRLIDDCGHERCYTCMFNKGVCPLCNAEGMY